ncbi:MAG: c-type cytochrome [bacterium]
MNFKIIYKMLLFVLISILLASPEIAGAYNNNSQGQYLFNYYNCTDCHIIKGVGGTLGPSLSNYGNKNKIYRWTVAQIENPQSHYKVGSEIKINGKTYYAIMPSYNYIPYGDIEKLASYLDSLKK